jgi:hypothetical protein
MEDYAAMADACIYRWSSYNPSNLAGFERLMRKALSLPSRANETRMRYFPPPPPPPPTPVPTPAADDASTGDVESSASTVEAPLQEAPEVPVPVPEVADAVAPGEGPV